MSNGLSAINGSGSHAEILSHLAPAVSGSCALVAMHDPAMSILRVACVGDSRAVLGRKVQDNWNSTALSEDQSPNNESERDCVLAAHPGEQNLIDTESRLLGLPLTRSFGDHRWKWPLEAIAKGCPKFYANPPRPNYHSPPYLTAEPVIQSIKPQTGDFLILASDGIWDNISSENAVKCVGGWIDEKRKRSVSGTPNLGDISADYAESTIVPGGGKDMSPMGESWGWEWSSKDLVIEDNNAATHLAKNALGGNRREQFCSVMSTQAPESRDARDDLSVQVIFFGVI